MSRWIRVSTSIFDHGLFSEEPFTEREAWLWLISKAAWKPTKHRVGGAMVEVPVGSVFVTLRELQDTWKWGSDYRVRAFLKLLQTEEMILVDVNAGKTRITICNYLRYQNAERTENAQETQQKRTENALKTPVHQDTNTSSLRSEETRVPAKPAFKAEFDQEFWPIYPNKVGKPVALKAFVKARSQADLQTIITGLRRYVAKTDDRAWCNPSTWLNQERWNDQPAAVPAARQQSPPREKTILDVLNERIERSEDERLQPKTINGEYQTGPRHSADLRFLADASRRRG